MTLPCSPCSLRAVRNLHLALDRGRKSFERIAKAHFAAAGADVVSGAVVEVGERDGGNAHVAGGGRFHGFADDLGGGGNGNQIEFFAERADQNRLPETFDGFSVCAVVAAPVAEKIVRCRVAGSA